MFKIEIKIQEMNEIHLDTMYIRSGGLILQEKGMFFSCVHIFILFMSQETNDFGEMMLVIVSRCLSSPGQEPSL
mgnify:CR=1 FL=1